MKAVIVNRRVMKRKVFKERGLNVSFFKGKAGSFFGISVVYSLMSDLTIVALRPVLWPISSMESVLKLFLINLLFLLEILCTA